MKKLVLASMLALSLSAFSQQHVSANGCLNFGFGVNFTLFGGCDSCCGSGCCAPCFPCVDPALLGVPYGGYPGLPYACPPGGYGHAMAGYAYAPQVQGYPAQQQSPANQAQGRPASPVQRALYQPVSYQPATYNYPAYSPTYHPYGYYPASSGFGN